MDTGRAISQENLPTYRDAPTCYRGLEGVHQWGRLMDEIWIDWGFDAERFFEVFLDRQEALGAVGLRE